MSNPYSSNRNIRLEEVSVIERAVNNKIYDKGCTLIPLSASDYRLIQLLTKESSVSNRYAVVVPKKNVNGEYLHIAIKRAAEHFFTVYQTGINLQIGILQQFFLIQYHDNPDTQKQIVNQIQMVDQSIRDTTHEIEIYKNLKKAFLNKMMI